MTKEQYIQCTEYTRSLLKHLPSGEMLLRVPTFLCAAIYLTTLAFLILQRDPRAIRAAAVPAACFALVTFLRPIIHRQRPYDALQFRPVGAWEPGKGKSMPSRHAVSAVAIAIAVIYVYPTLWVFLGMTLLGAVICILRVVSGQHYPSDVAAAVILVIVVSIIGYGI